MNNAGNPQFRPGFSDSAIGTGPLSRQQEQVWFRHKFAPDSVAHNAQTTIRVVGAFDLDRFDRVITEIDRRHETLRTTYAEIDGEPAQTVHPPRPVRARRIDLGEVRDGQQELLDQVLTREMHTPFAVAVPPLIRWTAVRLAEDEHEIVLVEHHLLHDERTTALLIREVETLYNASAEGVEPPRAEPAVRYRDFARWQRSALETAPMRSQLAYWKDRLGDAPPRLDLPADRPRPTTQTFRGETLRVDLPPDLVAALSSFCRDRKLTMFGTMLAAFSAFLHRYTGQRDLCVGSSFAGRRPGTADAIGMYANTVLLRCDVDPTQDFASLAGQAHNVVREAAENELLPFPELVRVLNPTREPGRNPLTDILFSADESARPSLDLAGATGTVLERGNSSARTDLNVVVLPRTESRSGVAALPDGRITMLWEYAADLFDDGTVRRMADSYLRLLADAVARPAARLFELALLSPWDRALVLDEVNADRHPPADAPPVHEAVRAQAHRTPDAPAIRDGAREIGYAELVRRADALADVLRRNGVAPRTVVGVCLPRGADLVITELAVLCAGAAYLPLDPDNPPARLAGQYTAAGAVLIVTNGAVANRLPRDIAHLLLDRLPDRADVGAAGPPDPVQHNDLAYLIATSGSTGQPKIVTVEHRSLSNVVTWRRRRCDLGPADRVAQIASPGFDPSVTDIWPTLVAGATLCVPDQDTKLDPERLGSWLADEGITVTELPTALAERVLTLNWPAGAALRILIIGGDRLRIRPSAGLPFRVLNEYGPTETTATATAGEIEPAGPPAGPPDIGRPITGVSAYILDGWRQPVPPGVTGELWIGGVGVARGYHGAPGLTAQRFVPDPFSGVPGGRMYRTGDLARHLPDGRIDFIGRRDRQIKLRGYRIEPAEIVEALRAHPAVTDAVVLAVTDERGDKRLVAYVEAENRPALRQEVREHLVVRLPRYMMPTDFVVLDSLPINRNGKVDERALPAPGPAEPDPGFRAPGTGTQRLLADIWCRVLRLERVGLDDNFFDLGGHSLLLAAVQRELAGRGHALSIVMFFEYTTIHDLAKFLDDRHVVVGQDDESGAAARRGAGRARLDRRRAALRTAEPTTTGDSGTS
ncbi:amino acid adenylation domain-containing protein [Actinoplanes sp. M2I2]|uniref:non-ribosomal peptide synthetase n=1 Tax=Actinoplanes sp. M2I2 TaxID=1734444 RepID=UPI0020207BF6|nr:amino acid adenylation domain-containing protein [Actinoplanes sp. M2I2]